VDASPVITGNFAVVASADGRLRFIDIAKGTETWKYEIGSAISGTPAVTSQMVVVAAEDGKVYMLGKYTSPQRRKGKAEYAKKT
jgi:outer membrane protein assembly factor BamB